jgi:hypothetical protein
MLKMKSVLMVCDYQVRASLRDTLRHPRVGAESAKHHKFVWPVRDKRRQGAAGSAAHDFPSRLTVSYLEHFVFADIISATSPRWTGSKDPENALSQWFTENPDAKAELETIWQTGEAKLPWRDTPIPMRPAELGKRGRLDRKVWMAAGVDEAAARRVLGEADPSEAGAARGSVTP